MTYNKIIIINIRNPRSHADVGRGLHMFILFCCMSYYIGILVRPWPEWPERLPRPCKIDGGTYHCLHLLLLCGILHNTQEDEIPGKVLLERIEKVSLLLGRSHQSYPAELQLMKFFHYVGTNIGKIMYSCRW